MFSKFTSKPIKIPMLNDEDDTNNISNQKPTVVVDKSGINLAEDSNLADDCSVSIIEGILEQIDHLSEEKKPSNVVIVDGNLTFDNVDRELSKEESTKDLLSLSLHTTKSEDSVEMPIFHGQESKNDRLKSDELSFHVSQVDASKLNGMDDSALQYVGADNIEKATGVSDKIKNDDGIRVYATEDYKESDPQPKEPTETVSEKQDDQQPKAAQGMEEEGKSRKLFCINLFKISVMTLLLVVSGVRYFSCDVSDDKLAFEETLKSSQATSPLEKLLPLSASNITAVNIKSQFETLLPLSTINNTAVSIKVNTTGISFTVEDVVTKEENVALESWEGIKRKFCYWCMISLFLFIISGSKRSSSGGLISSTTSSYDEKTFVKQEEAFKGFDLSWYEKLKYAELRRLLRERNIKIYGKKPVMIRRLVAVYNSELGTLTVVQLRRKLKSKNIKFTGRKKEIIQKLVEAGI